MGGSARRVPRVYPPERASGTGDRHRVAARATKHVREGHWLLSGSGRRLFTPVPRAALRLRVWALRWGAPVELGLVLLRVLDELPLILESPIVGERQRVEDDP